MAAIFFASVDAPGDAQIDAGVVYPLILHEFPELPLGSELLPGRQGHDGAQPQHLVRTGVLGAQWVFYEEGPQRLGFATQPQRVGHIEAGMNIQYHLDLLAHRLAHRRKLIYGR